MDTPARRPSSELGAPPARKGWRRFSSRLGSNFGLYGGASLIVGYLSIIVLIPIAAVAAHGFSFSIHTHGWGAAFWHWHFSAGFGTFWKDITQPAAVKDVTSEEPTERGDRASLGNAPPAANLTPTAGAARASADRRR